MDPHFGQESLKKIMVHYLYSLVEGYAYSALRLQEFMIKELLAMMTNPWNTIHYPLKYINHHNRYAQALASISPPEWSTPNEIIYETNIALLRDFSVNPENRSTKPVLVVPPMSGQHSCIADYAPGQSQVVTMRQAGFNRVYAVEWLPANEKNKDVEVKDYIEFMHAVVKQIGEPVNIVGDCQGGWQSAIFTCLYPEDVNTLALVAAPIDCHAGNGDVRNYTDFINNSVGTGVYHWLVSTAGGVMSAENIMSSYMTMKPDEVARTYVDLYVNAETDRAAERFKAYASWCICGQDIPGNFFLWTVEELFMGNKLIRGEMMIGDRVVDMKNITCPLYLMGGEKDYIVPIDQVMSTESYVGTSPEKIKKLSYQGGHLGLFMGRKALGNQLSEIARDMLQYSRNPEN